jgi:DNA invertase Pin-like site-specific DNA recombinase
MPPINTGDRKELGKLLQSLAAGDQLLATRIDRLARSMFELFAIVKKSSTLPPYQISGKLGISES